MDQLLVQIPAGKQFGYAMGQNITHQVLMKLQVVGHHHLLHLHLHHLLLIAMAIVSILFALFFLQAILYVIVVK